MLNSILEGRVSGVGGVRAGLAQVSTPNLRANGHERFFGRANVAVIRINRAFVDGKARKEFASVEIVLRKAGQPQSGPDFVPLLHEVAALVDFSQEEADGYVFRDVSFDACELAGGLVDPHETVHFGEDRGEAGNWVENRGVA